MGVNQNAKKGIEYYQSLLPANAKNNSNNSTKKDLSYYQSLLSKENTAETAPISMFLDPNYAGKTLAERKTQSVLNSLLNYDANPNNPIGRMQAKTKEKLKNANVRKMTDEEKKAFEEKYKPNKEVDAAYYGKRAYEGLLGASEGVMDGATILGSKFVATPILKGAEAVTSLGGKAPNPVSEKMKELANETWQEIPKKMVDTKIADFYSQNEIAQYAPNFAQQLAGDVLSGASGMLPTIGSNLLLPGAGYATLGTQGFGSGVEDAATETGELGNKEMIYGGLSGLSEAAIEKLSGGIAGLGKGGLKELGEKVIKNRFVRGALGEGAEEMLQTAIDPLLKRATYDPDAELASAKDIAYAGAVGALTNLALGAPGEVSQTLRNNRENKKVQTQINQDIKNYKNIFNDFKPNLQNANNVKNVLRNSPQMAEVQQPNITPLKQIKMAQKANMEQINKNTTNNPRLQLSSTVSDVSNNNIGQNINDVNISKTNDTQKFSEQVEAWKENRINKNNELVVLEKTPQILLDLGLDDYPITLKPTKLNALYNETTNAGKNPHNLGELVKEIPEALKRPLNIVQSVTDPDSIVVVTDLADKNGDIVIVSLKPNTKGQLEIEGISKNENVNKLTSAYGKNSYDYIKDKETGRYKDGWMELNRKNDKILYDIDEGIIKKRINGQWLQSPNVAKTLSNNIIPNNDTNINTQYAQNISNDTADTQSAFSVPENYISPAEDIQKASDFINKATVNDIDTLNKMVEEAEKYPDRVDLQFFAEKARARLEKISREQVENMLEEGINQNKISYSDSIYRNLRRVLGEQGYQYVKEKILDKLDAAKLDNVNMKIEIANELKSYVVDELGIRKSSKESELVQKYGEKEITLNELKEATPNWENVVKADKWFRSKYDELIDRINESRTEIYPYIEERIEATELELEVVKQQIKDIEENGTPNYKKDAEIRSRIENIQKRIDAKSEKLESIKNKDTLAYKNNLRIKNEAESRLADLNELLDVRTENQLYKLKDKADKLQKTLDSEELWRGKRIPKRKDYYRHFQEMTEGFEALGNILATPAEISNQLSGISENTKPNSKWLGLAQRRLTNKTKYDAVGGFLNYLDSASYAINIDPEIKRIRDFTEEIRATAEDNTANRLIEYLTDYANDLAGKTNPMDRYIQKVIPGGRKTMKAISWVTNRIKSNAVLGNFNSAAAQILNLPQGLADIKNPKNIALGVFETISEPFAKTNRYKDSQFINERFNSDIYSQFDDKLINQPKKMAVWLLGALDELGTKTIWNGEYRKAVDLGIKDPVRYADYRTRDLVAGRGIGELSLNQRSKTIGLLAPFTVEVSNYWGVVKDFISAKDFGGLILLQVFGHLFNKGLEELGVSAGVFDLIDALIDAWNTEGGIDKKVGRVAGEFLSNTMFGQQIASLYPENGADLGVYKLPTRSELFGDADPTRMGTGSVLSKAISNPVTSVVLPWGGTQVNKTAQGLYAFAKGGSYTKDAEGNPKLKYPVEQNFENAVKSALFGKWATKSAKGYIDRGFKPLSANQTKGYEKAKNAGITDKQFYDAYNAQKGIESDKDKDGKTITNSKSLKKKQAIDEATKGLNANQKKILYDAFDVSKTVQEGKMLPTQEEQRAKLKK